ncbi:MAG: hypothetical protein AAB299_00420, partial [Thermodesulfobacteriota bacterium]
MGKSRRARKLSVDFMGMKQIAWVDPDGSVLREEGILGIALERVTREEALAGLEGAVSADLTEIASIPSSKPIEGAAALRVLKIRLEGLQQGSFFLDGDRQIYRNGVLTIRRESSVDPSARSGGAAGDLGAFLKPTPFIQSDHPKIRQKLAEIVGPGDPDGVKADKLVAWVHKNLEKRPVLWFRTRWRRWKTASGTATSTPSCWRPLREPPGCRLRWRPGSCICAAVFFITHGTSSTSGTGAAG